MEYYITLSSDCDTPTDSSTVNSTTQFVVELESILECKNYEAAVVDIFFDRHKVIDLGYLYFGIFEEKIKIPILCHEGESISSIVYNINKELKLYQSKKEYQRLYKIFKEKTQARESSIYFEDGERIDLPRAYDFQDIEVLEKIKKRNNFAVLNYDQSNKKIVHLHNKNSSFQYFGQIEKLFEVSSSSIFSRHTHPTEINLTKEKFTSLNIFHLFTDLNDPQIVNNKSTSIARTVCFEKDTTRIDIITPYYFKINKSEIKSIYLSIREFADEVIDYNLGRIVVVFHLRAIKATTQTTLNVPTQSVAT